MCGAHGSQLTPLLESLGEAVTIRDLAGTLVYANRAGRRRERYGTDRLRRLLAQHAGAEPRDLLDALESSLSAFGDGGPSDDVAALALAPVH